MGDPPADGWLEGKEGEIGQDTKRRMDIDMTFDLLKDTKKKLVFPEVDSLTHDYHNYTCLVKQRKSFFVILD